MESIQLTNIKVVRQGHVILHDLSQDFPCNQITTIVGMSGSGKTTLLQLLGGLLSPSEGKVDSPFSIKETGMVWQRHGLFEWFTVEQNIALAYGNLRISPSKRKAYEEWLALLNIEELKDRYPHQLSGGQSQRVALARALFKRVPLLLLDEPTSSLDEVNRLQFEEMIRRIHQDHPLTIVWVTHQLDQAFKMGQSVIWMHDGTIQEALSFNPLATKEEKKRLIFQWRNDMVEAAKKGGHHGKAINHGSWA